MIACALSIATGCGADTPAAPAATSTTPALSAVGNDADPKDGEPQTDAIGLRFEGMTVEPQDGYARVTFEFNGPAAPGWDVRFVGQPLRISTSDPFPVAGTKVLEVRIREAANPFGSTTPPYAGPETVPGPPDSGVTEVKFGGTFRNVTQAFIGTTREYPPFRVSALQDPPRIVVEVAK